MNRNRKIRNIPREHLLVAELMNTVNGGMAVPQVKIAKNRQAYLVKIKAPGVSGDALRVDIFEDNLFVYHLITGHTDELSAKPIIIKVIPIPANVNVDHVSANYEEGHLRVVMPIDKSASGFRKNINIRQN